MGTAAWGDPAVGCRAATWGRGSREGQSALMAYYFKLFRVSQTM